jgi:hypothetical protein
LIKKTWNLNLPAAILPKGKMSKSEAIQEYLHIHFNRVDSLQAQITEQHVIAASNEPFQTYPCHQKRKTNSHFPLPANINDNSRRNIPLRLKNLQTKTNLLNNHVTKKNKFSRHEKTKPEFYPIQLATQSMSQRKST